MRPSTNYLKSFKIDWCSQDGIVAERLNANCKLERYVRVVKYRLHMQEWLVYYYEVVKIYNGSKYY